MKILVLILSVLLIGCVSNLKDQAPVSGMWKIHTEDSLYYEFYWDRFENCFYYSGQYDNCFGFDEDRTELIQELIAEISSNPERERSLIIGFIEKIESNKNFVSSELVGRYVYYIDSNIIYNYELYCTRANERAFNWRQYGHAVSTDKIHGVVLEHDTVIKQ